MGGRPSKNEKTRWTANRTDRWSVYKDDMKEQLLWNTFLLKPKPMSILLVFQLADQQLRTLVQAAKLGGYEYEHVSSLFEAQDACRKNHFCLMMIDARQDDQTVLNLPGQLAQDKWKDMDPELMIISAVIDRKPKTEQHYTMATLIATGVTRQFFETDNVYECLNEYRCIERGELLLQSKLCNARSLLVAVRNSNEAVEVANTYDEILYMNPASERLFAYEAFEMRGQSMKRLTRSAITRSDVSAVASCRQALRHGKAWSGMYNIRRRNGERIFQTCRCYPMSSPSIGTEHLKLYVSLRNVIPSKNVPSRKKSLTPYIHEESSSLIPYVFLPAVHYNIPAEPASLSTLLTESNNWGFDIFELEKVTASRPLYHLGMKVLNDFSAPEVLRVDHTTLSIWLRQVEAHYHTANEYHNSTHAADVTHATCCYLRTERGQVLFDKMDQIVLILGAIVHDIDHPARTNQSLINGQEPLAILYNDESMLECHHSALIFQLTLKDPIQNIFKNLTREEYVQVRKQLIDAILATDMRRHFELLEGFKQCIANLPPLDPKHVWSKQERKLIFQSRIPIEKMLIKCSDVSNPARPLSLCMQWGERIKNEYISQSAMEIESGIPVSMTAYMPDSCDLPNSQWKFMKAFCIPMFQAWSDFIQMPECFENVRHNYEHWRKMDWSVPREKSSMEEFFPAATRLSRISYTSEPLKDAEKPQEQSQLVEKHRSMSVALGNRKEPSVRPSTMVVEGKEAKKSSIK